MHFFWSILNLKPKESEKLTKRHFTIFDCFYLGYFLDILLQLTKTVLKRACLLASILQR